MRRQATELCLAALTQRTTPPDAWAVKLCERAKAEQWQVDSAIDWSQLQLHCLPASVRVPLSRIYSRVQVGEVLALTTIARAVDRAPELWVKMFGVTQLVDESRHVEFFSRVIAALGEPAPVGESMQRLVDSVDAVQSMDEILLGTQILLEGYAQSLFVEASRLGVSAATRRIKLPGALDPGPLVRAISDFIGRDESRHVAFGVLYLRRRWHDLDKTERSTMQDRAYHWASLLDAVIAESSDDLRRIGVDTTRLVARVRRSQATHFRQIGFDT